MRALSPQLLVDLVCLSAGLGVCCLSALAEESLDADVPLGDVSSAVRSLLAAMQCRVTHYCNGTSVSALGSLPGPA